MSVASGYKGFVIHGASKAGTHLVTYRLKHGNYHLPRRFYWKDINNFRRLEEYLDALIHRDTLLCQRYEEAEIAVGHEYESYEGTSPLISVSVERLIRILRCEDVLEVPADTTIRIRTSDGGPGRFVPYEFVAALADSDLDEFTDFMAAKRSREGKPLKAPAINGLPQTEKKSGNAKCIDAVAQEFGHSGAMLEAAEKAGIRGSAATPPGEPPLERVIKANETDTGIDTVSVIEQQGTQPYFCRRIISPQGSVLYSATSWSVEGPWAVHRKDAIGLQLAGFWVEQETAA